MSEKPDTLQQHASELPGRIFKPGALRTILTLVAGGVLSLSGYALAQAKLKGQIDGGVEPVKASVAQLRNDLEAHTRVEAEARAELGRKLDAAEQVNARRFEVLINTVLERRLQPGTAELAQPQTDGGR